MLNNIANYVRSMPRFEKWAVTLSGAVASILMLIPDGSSSAVPDYKLLMEERPALDMSISETDVKRNAASVPRGGGEILNEAYERAMNIFKGEYEKTRMLYLKENGYTDEDCIVCERAYGPVGNSIRESGGAFGVESQALAVAAIESKFSMEEESGKGARGTFQITPFGEAEINAILDAYSATKSGKRIGKRYREFVERYGDEIEERFGEYLPEAGRKMLKEDMFDIDKVHYDSGAMLLSFHYEKEDFDSREALGNWNCGEKDKKEKKDSVDHFVRKYTGMTEFLGSKCPEMISDLEAIRDNLYCSFYASLQEPAENK